MAAAVKAVNARAHEAVDTPALFVFDDRDILVDHARTREIAARWGGAAEVFAVDLGPEDDPGHHVIAGDILSPGMTRVVVEKVVAWARAL